MYEKQGKTGRLVCEVCGVFSKPYPITSPAAPELSICEQAGKDGWDYNIGFYAMLLGHTTWCPDCVVASQQKVTNG